MISTMRDPDIRPTLRDAIRQELRDVVLFEELPLCRSGRADIAAVNCHLWGFEIKSEVDSLNRLPGQIDHYDRIFDFSTVVTAANHLKYVRRLVPAHWGIRVARASATGCTLQSVRRPKKNAGVCTESQIRLLWRREAVRVLRSFDADVTSDMLVRELWDRLSRLPKRRLRKAIVQILKERSGSESVARRTSGDDSAATAASAGLLPGRRSAEQPR